MSEAPQRCELSRFFPGSSWYFCHQLTPVMGAGVTPFVLSCAVMGTATQRMACSPSTGPQGGGELRVAPGTRQAGGERETGEERRQERVRRVVC